MAITTMGGVISRTQALLDDPAGRRFKPDYLRPYVDEENEEFQIDLQVLGVQQEQAEAIIPIPAAVSAPTDLTPYFATGQPLQYFLRPRYVDWKVTGQPDTSYVPSGFVAKLDDVDVGNLGCQQYRWTGGTLLLTPSYTPVTLRIGFDSLSQTIYDSAANVMRGIGNMLTLRVAKYVCALNNGMGKLGPELEKKSARAERKFANLLVMQNQSQLIIPMGTKRGTATQLSAGGVSFM